MDDLRLTIESPDKVFIPEELVSDRLVKFLTYRDSSVVFELQKIKKARWYNPESEWCIKRTAELEQQKYRKLIFYTKEGRPYTYSGLAEEIGTFLHVPVENRLLYPKTEALPWLKKPDFEMRPYQTQALEKLLAAKHGAVSIGTGLGKSAIILHIVKALGLSAVVMAPSVSIASQLYEMFVQVFGKRYVGMFGDGKKQSGKKIVIGIAASLTRLEEGTEHYKNIAEKQVFISDESHLTPAATLERVCFDPMKNASYRFFFSATQMRGDGADQLLRGIIGPIVYHMTVADGVNQGYLARPVFNMMVVHSDSNYSSRDANNMDRKHLLLNPVVIRNAAELANRAWTLMKAQTLILIDEFTQATMLDRYLTVPREFAHGGNAADKGELPEKFWKSDVEDQVKRFNNGEFPVLIGTSAIGLGTDIRTAKVLIIIQKGTSQVKFMQSVGRGTRKVPGKDVISVFDFDVENIDIVHRHAKTRAKIYEEIIGEVKYVRLGTF